MGPRGRLRAGGALVARGEFSIVIAGLAVATEPRIGPIATAYVLILVVLGPLTARWTEPAVGRLRGAFRRKPGPRADPPPGHEEIAEASEAGATTN
jgi:CPA2 family monovalent cation:H+ antiporter-2